MVRRGRLGAPLGGVPAPARAVLGGRRAPIGGGRKRLQPRPGRDPFGPELAPNGPPSGSASASATRSRSRSVASAAVSREAAAATRKPWRERTARLVLSDGSVFSGSGFGAEGTVVAEVVFNTSLTGYQEVLTDPSYFGQFVVFTLPHIGNVGVNALDSESTRCHLKGAVVRHLSENVSNYRSDSPLHDYLVDQGVVGIAGVDTREVTKKLRVEGSLVGVITTETESQKSNEQLKKMASEWSILGKDLIGEVTCSEPYEWSEATEDEWAFNLPGDAQAHGNGKVSNGNKLGYRVVAYDYGIKRNILRRLASHGCSVTVVPASYPAEKVLAMRPDGIFFSNGPGDPSAAPYCVDNATKVLQANEDALKHPEKGSVIPCFGICMGHQILGQALGGETFKLKFGHHGGNHPIKNQLTGKVEISAQNHNFAVDASTLGSVRNNVRVTHTNLNDGTVAGMFSEDLQMLTIQYHPEASPGPHDADVAFQQFVDMMRAKRNKE